MPFDLPPVPFSTAALTRLRDPVSLAT